MLKDILSYVSGLDLDGVDDPELLRDPLRRIEGYESHVILNKETCRKLEAVLARCTLDQLVDFYKKISVRELAVTKMGSRAIERVYLSLFRQLYGDEVEHARAEEVLETVFESIDPHIDALFFDSSGTFVLRTYFELLSGVRTKWKEQRGLGLEDTEETQHVRGRHYSRFRKLCRAYADYFSDVLERIFEQAFTAATFSVYLECSRKQRLIEAVIDRHCSPGSIRKPVFSYFFESLVGFVASAHLERIFQKIRDEVARLGVDENSNYVVRRLADRYNPVVLYEHIAPSLKDYPKSSNVVVSLLCSLYRVGEREAFLRIFTEFYGPGDFFGGHLLRNGKVVQKYVGLASLVMSLRGRPGDDIDVIKQINEDFLKEFNKAWLREDAGRRLATGFLTGSATPRQKRRFISSLKSEYQGLARNPLGRRLLGTMAGYAERDTKLKIVSILKRHRREGPICSASAGP